jgi:hypothetical protein
MKYKTYFIMLEYFDGLFDIPYTIMCIRYYADFQKYLI